MSFDISVYNSSPKESNRKQSIPASKELRSRIIQLCAKQSRVLEKTNFLTMDNLLNQAGRILAENDIDHCFTEYTAVEIGNLYWKKHIEAVPYEKRILLLPHCLRSQEKCCAEVDGFGLLCMECGSCPLGFLQKQAEDLGMQVIIAEGTTMVHHLVKKGKIDAVIGAGCLSSLKKSFSRLTQSGIPGLAVPLLSEGCVDTVIDTDRLLDIINTPIGDAVHFSLDFEKLEDSVNSWFEPDTLGKFINPASSETEKIIFSWMTKSGKRLRPLLLLSIYMTLAKREDIPRKAASLGVAVECFHKASLIHDDIEDNDDVRYGESTLHVTHGVGVALNAGDLLIGEGYRLIAEAGFDPSLTSRMIAETSRSHRALCLGQGEELLIRANPSDGLGLSSALEIARNKTSAAFYLAIMLGTLASGAGEKYIRVISDYTDYLGIAYQIADDLDDFTGSVEAGQGEIINSPIVLAALFEECTQLEWELIVGYIVSPGQSGIKEELALLAEKYAVYSKVTALFEEYKQKTLDQTGLVDDPAVRSFLLKTALRILRR